MTLYKRRLNCAVCGFPVYYDSKVKVIWCKCMRYDGIEFDSDNLKKNFVRVRE
ncbi:MAG: hypothetical protein KIH08_15780 [Candidatus Freyarchaeota archaeon]|nr:hypothetical protein [Candidatus Jordarchaeia archaeon]